MRAAHTPACGTPTIAYAPQAAKPLNSPTTSTLFTDARAERAATAT